MYIQRSCSTGTAMSGITTDGNTGDTAITASTAAPANCHSWGIKNSVDIKSAISATSCIASSFPRMKHQAIPTASSVSAPLPDDKLVSRPEC